MYMILCRRYAHSIKCRKKRLETDIFPYLSRILRYLQQQKWVQSTDVDKLINVHKNIDFKL